MAKLSIFFGLLLIATGLVGQYLLESRSTSALIPTIPGVLLLILGALAMKFTDMSKHFMHASAVISSLGSLVLFMAVPKLPDLISGTAQRPNAIIMQLIMGLLCLIFLILCIRSFRRARQAQSQT
ncbi:MAG: hypothetical protein NZM04_10935 [Methylacidiphilales bacterium]|nr:hypothetical protein [Candidatus Methylacidiphilales bacterium]MDW8349950.1 hypothetical protein [Verrucomicrobiae bacterium]